ncbi:hypothetical protein [Microbacterium enclense]|uniref:hypothetical protein n=1 Tax=Microbacterium enclense TaxID=993073 RepID=UPI003F7EF018
MTARKTTPTAAPQFARYAEKEATPTMQAYAEWLTRETGYAVDVKSVLLASWLRGEFQKSEDNQARITSAKTRKAEEAEARAARRAEREAKAAERAAKQAAREAERIAKAKAVLAAAGEKAA